MGYMRQKDEHTKATPVQTRTKSERTKAQDELLKTGCETSRPFGHNTCMYDLYIKQPIRILYPIHYRSVLLRKESFTSDGHQFHQYQQNKQSPLKRKFHQ